MHVGLVMECDYRYGETEQSAFDEAFAMAEAAEMGGLNGVWLAERSFCRAAQPAGHGRGRHSVGGVRHRSSSRRPSSPATSDCGSAWR